MLYRIIYTSRASRYYDHAEMRELCAVSTTRNQQDKITGLFLYDGVRFLQALEGEQEQALMTMRRIAADARHHDIIYSFRGPALRREFPNWSMEVPFRPGDDAHAFLEKVKHDVRLVSDLDLKAQFIGFAKLASTGRNRLQF